MLDENVKREMMIRIDFERRAKAERESGGYVQINLNIPYIAITMSNGDEYYFQGDEAANLIAEAEKAFHGNIHLQDYLLATAQGW
jgi:hypothetical protein